jgi:hypothetical protein
MSWSEIRPSSTASSSAAPEKLSAAVSFSANNTALLLVVIDGSRLVHLLLPEVLLYLLHPDACLLNGKLL